MRTKTFSAVVCALVVSATSAFAVTYIVPTDGDLAKRAEAIVIVTAGESHAELTARGGIVTVVQLEVGNVLKGTVAKSIRLVELGGILSERATLVPGSPRYEAGKRYLVFLRKNAEGEWATWGFQLGQFELGTDLRGRELAVRAGGESLFGINEADGSLYTDRYRSLPEFLASITGGAAADYFVDRSDVLLDTFARPASLLPAANATRPDYLMSGNFRWQNGGTATWGYCCPGSYPTAFGSNSINASGAATSASQNWNVSPTSVHYTMGGETPGKNAGFTASNGANTILFNDPNNEVPTGGVVAIGGVTNTSGTYPLSDGTYNNTIEGDVVVGKNTNIPTFVTQQIFVALLTHEVGHTLGFRHSDKTADDGAACAAPSPCASPGAAIMAHIVQSPAFSLKQWDLDAVNTVYGSGPACTPAAISTQPAGGTINSGQSLQLSVVASGTASFSYLWYIGNPPDVSTPAPGVNNGQTYTASPTTTTTYWVRVTNSCNTGGANSAAATVTVNPTSCTPASITTEPAGSTISSGQFANLSVGAAGTAPLTYQWYIGSSPDTSTPFGSGQSINVSPASTTSYWVRVTNTCGTADSRAAIVQVTSGCTPPTIINDPPDQQITSGTSTSLFVGYSGSTSTVTWYRGLKPDVSNPVGSGQSFITGALTTTTQYWAQLVNSCGSAQSRQVAVSVTTACVAPNITLVDASPKTCAPGDTVTLTAQATGTSLQYQWYRGTPPNLNNPVAGANTATATDTPPASTSYFVHVSNSCGSQNSSAIAIAVTIGAGPPPCTPPSITKITDDTTISSNTSVTLEVTASGDPVLHYQWYRGASGDASNPVGTDSPFFTTPALFSDSQFWVKVSNACAPPAFSRSMNVTVLPARHRASRH